MIPRLSDPASWGLRMRAATRRMRQSRLDARQTFGAAALSRSRRLLPLDRVSVAMRKSPLMAI